MTIKSYERGHEIFYDSECEVWRYSDTKEEINGKRSCKRCGKAPTKEGYDACKGYIKGATSVCCGHGIDKSIEIKNG